MLRLAGCQALLTAAVLVAQTLGTIEARRLSGSVEFAGSAISAQLVGAVGALLRVRRRPVAPDRLPGLVAVGFGAVAAGALLCGAGVVRNSLLALLAGNALLGAGAAVALLLRTAATSLYPPPRRARAVAFVAIGGVGGGMVAPLLVRLGPRIASSDSTAAAVPWIGVAMCAALAALIARSVTVDSPAERTPAGEVATRPARRAAIVVCVVAGIAMVAIMSTATLQLHHLGASDDIVATVIAVHYAAMFGFAVPFGLLADRWGRRSALVAASTLLAISGLTLAADPHRYVSFAVVLGLVGAGWSGAFVTGTAMLADASARAARTALVARNDLVVAVTSAVAALAATVLFARGGPESVGAAIAALGVVAVFTAYGLPRAPRPAHDD